MMNRNRKIARQRLDERLSAFKPQARSAIPPKGWVRAIRDALGMSGPQLGMRLGIKAQSVSDLEKSEARGTIQLNTLRKVAQALDCAVVYALVPNTSLEDSVQTRARAIARKELAQVGHSMELETQGLPETEHEAQVLDYVHEHLRERDLWERS